MTSGNGFTPTSIIAHLLYYFLIIFMTTKNYITEGFREFKEDMKGVMGSVKKHKSKILWAIAGIGLLWAAAKSNETRAQATQEETRAQAERAYQAQIVQESSAEILEATRSLKERFAEWSKLEPLDTFIKNNPGKDFEFYYAQAEKIDNDPTASIDDGGEQTQRERILGYIQHHINTGKYTLQDISMTSSWLQEQIKEEQINKILPVGAPVKLDEDGDDGYDEENLPEYIKAIDRGEDPK